MEPAKAQPYLIHMPEVRAVTWNVYGTLLSLVQGELLFEHPQQFVMDVALDKTIQEFRMWNYMYRKPGPPSEQLRSYYGRLLDEQRMVTGGAGKVPEVCAAKLWDTWVHKLFEKEYKFDTSFFGSLDEYSRKIAYFFHASLQATACYKGAVIALRHVTRAGLAQGLIADGQCFTTVQLKRGLVQQDPAANLDEFLTPDLVVLSHEVRLRKPSEKLFRQTLSALGQRGIRPDQVLHIGSRIVQDIVPARRLGMKTALFAGDKASLQTTKEQLRDTQSRPDVMLTALNQVTQIVG